MKKLLGAATALVLAAAAGNAMAANNNPTVSATGTASAHVVTPLSLAYDNQALSFGNITSAAAGTVTVTSDATGSRSSTGGTGLIGGAAGGSAAKFTVSGEGSFAYTVSVPASVTMGSLTASLTPGTLPTQGSGDFYVGGQLNVPTNTTAGDYTGTFNVTASYN